MPDEELEKRVVRLEDGHWRVQTDTGQIEKDEIARLREYLDEIRMPYKTDKDGIGIEGAIKWEDIDERLQFFYDGIAEVYPF